MQSLRLASLLHLLYHSMCIVLSSSDHVAGHAIPALLCRRRGSTAVEGGAARHAKHSANVRCTRMMTSTTELERQPCVARAAQLCEWNAVLRAESAARLEHRSNEIDRPRS